MGSKPYSIKAIATRTGALRINIMGQMSWQITVMYLQHICIQYSSTFRVRRRNVERCKVSHLPSEGCRKSPTEVGANLLWYQEVGCDHRDNTFPVVAKELSTLLSYVVITYSCSCRDWNSVNLVLTWSLMPAFSTSSLLYVGSLILTIWSTLFFLHSFKYRCKLDSLGASMMSSRNEFHSIIEGLLIKLLTELDILEEQSIVKEDNLWTAKIKACVRICLT